MGLNTKKELIYKAQEISINKQCKIVGVKRSTMYYRAKPKYTAKIIDLFDKIEDIYEDRPYMGHRTIYQEMLGEGYEIGRDRVLKYMKLLGIEAIYPKKKRDRRGKAYKKYPYLLGGLEITHPNQVWCSDLSYIPMSRGFCYLVAIMDCYSRKILSWRLSNSLDASFCIEALEEALRQYGSPEIFNTDQGSQFTSKEYITTLEKHNIRISMASTGRAIDNVLIERFFRSIKYENIYLFRYDTVKKLKQGIADYMQLYNYRRKHSSLEYKTPAEYYFKKAA